MHVAAGAVVGQRLRAGQADQLPRHRHVVRAVLARLEHLVHVRRTRDERSARSVLADDI